MAGGVGAVLATLITPEILRWILIVSFAAMAACMISASVASGLAIRILSFTVP